MSRNIEVDLENKCIVETVQSMQDCRHLCNDVCCNELCDNVGEFVDPDYCRLACPHFTKEDGIIETVD